MNKDKVLQYLGLCRRANKLVMGESFVVEKIKNKKTYLVFLAKDAGYRTTKKIRDKTKFYNIKLIEEFNTIEINKAIGRKNIKVIGIIDNEFYKMIEKQLEI
ncbi:MAG: hypothetical protein B6I17_03230 [Tenericutes bacterium 4572_104]|nr:MAG: hypothetical protein B6I17_03230 [Tenericutes bacterium 4572_104]